MGNSFSSSQGVVETRQEMGRKSDMAWTEITKSLAACPLPIFWPVTAARDEALAVFNEGPLPADCCLPRRAAIGQNRSSVDYDIWAD
jgi:hypothetical protein